MIIPISQLKNWDKNPREIDEKQFAALCRYIKRWGLLSPLLVDSRDKQTVLGGNMRLKACIALGIEEVDVKYVEVTNDDEALEVALLDNNQFGSYVESQLVDLIKGSTDIQLEDFTLAKVETTMADLLANNEITIEQVIEVEADAAEELTTNIIVGDLIEIGEHRLMCGDSTDYSVFEKLFLQEQFQLLHTDPPYGVNYMGRGKNAKTLGAIKNDSIEGLDELLNSAFSNAYTFANSNASAYVWHTDQKGDVDIIFKQAFKKAGWKQGGIIIWYKPSAGMGWNDYRYQYEPCIYGWKDSHEFYGDRTNTNVWKLSRDGDGSHPTMKPIELCAKAVKNSSQKNEIVLDMFGGSDSTMVAAEQLERRCYMIELDPKYCQVIINRMRKLVPNIKIKINGKEEK